MKKQILLVDGYNMIASGESTKGYFKRNQLDAARNLLLNRLSNYASFEGLEITCVFDAQHVPGIRQRYDEFQVVVIFTEEDETADSYIERLAAQLNTGRNQVSVATSDLNEQWTVFAQGALRVSARELEKRTAVVKKDLDKFVDQVDIQTPRLTPWSDQNMQTLQELLGQVED